MTISEAKSLKQHKRYTGTGSVDFKLDRRRVQLLLARRLREKITGYERAARDLEESGETDAANALYLAARKLKTITQRRLVNKSALRQRT